MQPIYILRNNIHIIGVFDSLSKVKDVLIEDFSGKNGWLSFDNQYDNEQKAIDYNNFETIVEPKFGKPRWFPVYVNRFDIARDPYGENLRDDHIDHRDTYRIHKVFMNNDESSLYALDSEKYKQAEKNIEIGI